MNPIDYENAITELEATGDYLVLRKLNMNKELLFTQKPVQGSKIAICLDTETTGLGHAENKIIELAIVAFEYDPITGDIIRITDRYSGFENPGYSLPEIITDITGITDEMVAGRIFDDDIVNSLAREASLVIAHNADFDRKFVEARFSQFANLPWACTLSQIKWESENVPYKSLEYLLYKCRGYFFKAHRALDDTEALLWILLGQLPKSRTQVFKALLDSSNELMSRIYAVDCPFERKDLLKSRGYRWCDGLNSCCKGWTKTVPRHLEQEELNYIVNEIYHDGNTNNVQFSRIDAFSRYSVREELISASGCSANTGEHS